MNWLLDGILIGILLLGMLIGYRRGAVRTLLEFVGFFAAVIVAIWLSGMIAEPLFNGLFRAKITETVQTVLVENAGTTAAAQTEKLLEALPGFLANRIGAETLSEQLQTVIGSAAESAAEKIVEQAIAPMAILLIRILLAIVLFVVCKLLIRWVIRACDLIAKLPVLRQLNQTLGLILGLLKAVLIVLVLLTVLRAVVPMVENPGVLSEETRKETLVFNWAYERNPLYQMISPDESVE